MSEAGRDKRGGSSRAYLNRRLRSNRQMGVSATDEDDTPSGGVPDDAPVTVPTETHHPDPVKKVDIHHPPTILSSSSISSFITGKRESRVKRGWREGGSVHDPSEVRISPPKAFSSTR